jgi:hypothetical protein
MEQQFVVQKEAEISLFTGLIAPSYDDSFAVMD